MTKKDLFNMLIHENGIYEDKDVILKSGEESNFYYDFGKVDNPNFLRYTTACLTDIIDENELNLNTDCFFTSPYKGIAFTIALMMGCSVYFGDDMINIKMGYVRKEKKDHGDKRDIIGHLPEQNENVILVDDVFSTGKSVLEMYDYLKATECHIKAILVLINRSEGGIVRKVSKKIGSPIYWISTHDEVMASRAKIIFEP